MKTNIVIFGGLFISFLIWAAFQRHQIKTQIVINASPDRVWQVLTDTANYPQWNPQITELKGHLKSGQRLEAKMRFKDSQMTIQPIVQSVIPNQEFSWKGQLWLPRLFDGHHYFRLQALDDGQKTQLEHGEDFQGILVLFLQKMLEQDTKAGFIRLNEALKAEVERIS